MVVMEDTGHRRGPEHVRAVLENDFQRRLDLEPDIQVELGGARVQRHPAHAHARNLATLFGRVLQDEHHLEQRAVARIGPGRDVVHQVPVRQVLVRVGAESVLAHAPEQLANGWIPRQAGA